jgi:hypothetical protein
MEQSMRTFIGWLVFISFSIIAVALLVWAADTWGPTKEQQQAARDKIAAQRRVEEVYKNERELVKICHNGSKIYKWNNKYWTYTWEDKWPDQEVNNLAVCQ